MGVLAGEPESTLDFMEAMLKNFKLFVEKSLETKNLVAGYMAANLAGRYKDEAELNSYIKGLKTGDAYQHFLAKDRKEMK